MQSEMELKTESRSRSWIVWIAAGGLLGFLGVVMGAAGTHVLEGRLDSDALDTLETSVRFQMYHAIALIALGGLGKVWKSRAVVASCALLTLGVVIFCGSLYMTALADIGAFGAVAPVGGLSLIAGWAALAAGAARHFIAGKA